MKNKSPLFGTFSYVLLLSVLVFYVETLNAASSKEFRVNAYDTSDSQRVVVAGLVQQRDGTTSNLIGDGFVVIWDSEEPDEPGYYDVYGRRYAADGTPIGSEFQVNTYTENRQRDASVAGLTNGGFVVVWGSRGQVNSQSKTDVYLRSYTADGSPEGSEMLVNTTTADNQSFPKIAVLAGGGFVVIWGNPSRLFGQLYGADGRAVGGEFRINQMSANNTGEGFSVAGLTNGGFVVVWKLDVDNGVLDIDFEINARRYTAGGSPVGGEFRVNTATTEDQDEPVVAALPDGGFLVVWQLEDEQIYARRYDEEGCAAGGEFRVDSIESTIDAFRVAPSVAVLPDGGFLVAWAGGLCPLFCKAADIYARRFKRDGHPIGREFLVSLHTGNKNYPSAATLADGRFMIVWELRNNSRRDTYARIFSTPLQIAITAGQPWLSMPAKPGRVFQILRTSNLELPFVEQDRAAAADDGILSWIDTNTVSGAQGFYMLKGL